MSKTSYISNLDHFGVNYEHLKIEKEGKYQLDVDIIRFRISSKKSIIEPKLQILLNTFPLYFRIYF